MGMLETRSDRYLALGAISAVISFLFLPIAGLVSIYSSIKIHDDVPAVYSYLIAAVGGISLLLWVVYLVTL